MANPTFKITMENGGIIEGELYPEKAPQSVYNFIDLCNHNYYDGLIFHRVITWFHIITIVFQDVTDSGEHHYRHHPDHPVEYLLSRHYTFVIMLWFIYQFP